MTRLILLRHGESVWNRDRIFTGWTDIDLSERGVAEAKEAARLLTVHEIQFDHCFTSVLKRAIRTLWILLDEMDLMWIPVSRSWRLNERHYGALQGRNKDETCREFGEEQVYLWRRSYSARPPPDDASAQKLRRERKYAKVPPEQIPHGESLEDTIARVLPYWHSDIVPLLVDGYNPIVVAHGNSIRGIVKYLNEISDENISSLEIPTGMPLIYDFDKDLRPIQSHYLTSVEGNRRRQDSKTVGEAALGNKQESDQK